MTHRSTLKISGEVAQPQELSFEVLNSLPDHDLILDVSRIDPKRQGDAIPLHRLLQLAGVTPDARYLGLHASTDNFHASIPLDPVRERAFVIFRVNGQPLSTANGGPFRFYIPDFAACHTHEIDECANVKFVDHMEFTRNMGFDNRPHDGQEHEELHRRQEGGM